MRVTELGDRLAHHVVEAGVSTREARLAEPGEAEQVFDQPVDSRRCVGDGAEAPLTRLIQARAGLPVEQGEEALDMPDRRAYVVGHRVGEGLQFAIGRLQLTRAIGARALVDSATERS